MRNAATAVVLYEEGPLVSQKSATPVDQAWMDDCNQFARIHEANPFACYEDRHPDDELAWYADCDAARAKGSTLAAQADGRRSSASQWPPTLDVAIDKNYLYRPTELAMLFSLSDDTVRRMFDDVPGVMRIGEQPKRTRSGRRPRITMRIPAAIARKIYHEHTR